MTWTISNGLIENIDGTAIYIADLSGGGTISGMTIRNANIGIQLGGPPQAPRPRLTTDELLAQIEAHAGELQDEDRKRVLEAVKQGKSATTDAAKAQTLHLIRDITVGVISSGIWAFLAQMMRLEGSHSRRQAIGSPLATERMRFPRSQHTLLPVLALLCACSAKMVSTPGSTAPTKYAPINEAGRGGVIKYRNQGLGTVRAETTRRRLQANVSVVWRRVPDRCRGAARRRWRRDASRQLC